MRPDATFIIKSALASIIFVATSYTAFLVGPWLETMYFPVVGRLTITAMERVDDTHTRIWVRFRKYRECPPIDVYWYQGRRDELFERVTFVAEKPIGGNKYINRPVGDQKSGPWVIGVPIEDIQDKAFSDSQHSCHPLWPTVSRFYG